MNPEDEYEVEAELLVEELSKQISREAARVLVYGDDLDATADCG